MMLRDSLKTLAEQAICRSGVLPLSRRMLGRDVTVLAYHNVVGSNDAVAGDASLHISRERFARQLDAIAETHDVIGLSQLVADRATRPRPCVVITFDDAYQGVLNYGVEELERRGFVATVFVAPGLLGLTPWWDVIADAEIGAVSVARREFALQSLAGRHAAVMAWAGRREERLPAPVQRICDKEALGRLARSPSIELGSHTWSHANLCALDGVDLRDELHRPLEWLQRQFAVRSVWLSYPYGMYSPSVERAAEIAGYAGAVTIQGGCLSGNRWNERFALPRVNIPAGLSLAGFRMRLAGLATHR